MYINFIFNGWPKSLQHHKVKIYNELNYKIQVILTNPSVHAIIDAYNKIIKRGPLPHMGINGIGYVTWINI